MHGVGKRYGGVVALDGVNFVCSSASIHAVLGENGAGKSTLIKIIAGAVRPDEGQLLIDERQVSFDSPIAAAREGIACIFQELSLMPDLSIADNICITNPPGRFGFIDARAQRRRAEELLARVGCEGLHPDGALGAHGTESTCHSLLPSATRSAVKQPPCLGSRI